MTTLKHRQHQNQAALNTLSTLDTQTLTSEARRTLAQYSGQGGVGASTDEYYTPATLAQAITARALTLTPGTEPLRVLEPSCGTGVFLRDLPADAAITGVEISSVSAQIARHLHPGADIQHRAFEQYVTSTPAAHGTFDLILGNTPFGTRRAPGMDMPNIREASRYFITRLLPLLRPGGMFGMIIPNGVARHAAGVDFRQTILLQAEILGVLGLSTDAFEESGASFATTDVLLLRRRTPQVQALLNVDGASRERLLNEPLNRAFLSGTVHDLRPDWLAGPVTTRRGYAGQQIFCRDGTLADSVTLIRNAALHTESQELGDALARRMTYGEMDEVTRDRWYALSAQLRQPAPRTGENRTVNGALEIYLRRWHSVSPAANIITQSLLRAGRAVRTHAEALAFSQDAAAQELAGQLIPLLTRLHPDVQTHRATLEKLSTFNPDLLAAFTSAQTNPPRLPQAVPGEPNRIREAFEDLQGQWVTTEKVAAHVNTDPDTVVPLLHAAGYQLTPHGWLSAGEYFTGPASVRLAELSALRDSQPGEVVAAVLDAQEQQVLAAVKRHSLENIPIHPGTSFITEHMLQSWANLTYPQINVDVLKHNNEVTVTGDAPSKHRTTLSYVRRYLTGRNRLKTETAEYAASDDHLRSFILARYGDELAAAYNAATAYLKPVYDTSDVSRDLIWYAGPTPHPNQNEAARRGMTERTLIDAQDVGLGKTITGLLRAALEYRETGRMSLITVPRNVLHKWRATALACLPGLDVQVIEYQGEQTFSDVPNLTRRVREVIRDRSPVVIMSHETYTRIQMPAALQLEILQREFEVQAGQRPSSMSELMYATYAQTQVQTWLEQGLLTEEDLSEAANDAGTAAQEAELALVDTDVTLNRSERKRYAQKLRFVSSKQARANNETLHPLDVLWTELDVGVVIIDEAHRMRRVMTATGRANIKYLSAPTDSSLRALSNFLKLRHLQHEGRGVHLLTATPIYNSLSDLYNLVNLARPDLFPSYGVHTLDAFITQYVETEQQTHADEDGNEETVDVMVGINNLPELQDIMALAIHRRTARDVGMHVPKVKREYHLHDVDDAQENIIQEIAEDPLGAVVQYLKPELTIPKDLSARNRMLEQYRFTVSALLRRAELDLEMLDPDAYTGHISPKVQACVDQIAGHLRTHRACVVFCDLLRYPRPASHRHFHEKLATLISRAAGIPRSQIGLINGFDTPETDTRAHIAEQFNGGQLRVVIGTRAAMGEGVDLQTDCVQGFGLDVPYVPGIQAQTEGRVARYPNPAPTVNFDYHLSNRALDPHMLDVLNGKLSWYDLLLSSEEQSIRAEFGSRAPTTEEIMTLRLKNRGEREAALRDIRERDQRAAENATRRAELRSAERYQQALQELRAAEQAATLTQTVTPALLDRLRQVLDVQAGPLAKFRVLRPTAYMTDTPDVILLKGQEIRVGTVLHHVIPPATKWGAAVDRTGTVISMDFLTMTVVIRTLPPITPSPYWSETEVVTNLRGPGRITVTSIEEILAGDAGAHHAQLRPVYQPTMEQLLKREYRQQGRAAFVLRDGTLTWDLPRQPDTLVTRWSYPAVQAQVAAFVQSQEARILAANLSPDTPPGLFWTVPGTPHAEKVHLEN